MLLVLVLMIVVPGRCWRCWRSRMIPSRAGCCVAWAPLRHSGCSTPTRPCRVWAGLMVRCGVTASRHRAGWMGWSSGCAWLRRAGSPL